MRLSGRSSGGRMIWKLIRKIYSNKISELCWNAYGSGWEDGVDQERLDPKSAEHHLTLDENGDEI